MSKASLHEQVSAFFDAFCEAFATFQGSEVAALYHVPHVAVRGDGSVDCVTSDVAVADFFQNALDAYHRAGCRVCTYCDLEVVPLGERSVVGTVTWELLDDAGAVQRRWRQSYNLIDLDGTWRVLTSTEHLSR